MCSNEELHFIWNEKSCHISTIENEIIFMIQETRFVFYMERLWMFCAVCRLSWFIYCRKLNHKIMVIKFESKTILDCDFWLVFLQFWMEWFILMKYGYGKELWKSGFNTFVIWSLNILLNKMKRWELNFLLLYYLHWFWCLCTILIWMISPEIFDKTEKSKKFIRI